MTYDPYNLGGAKPKMRAGSSDLLVTYGSAKKAGYYELCPYETTIYRRVELPEWMTTVIDDPKRRDTVLDLFKKGQVSIPETSSNERQGHIWFNPKRYTGSSEPCVGVDSEIVDAHLSKHISRTLVFVCYKFGKQEVEKWRISVSDFMKYAIRAKPSEGFEEQYFIPVSALSR